MAESRKEWMNLGDVIVGKSTRLGGGNGEGSAEDDFKVRNLGYWNPEPAINRMAG